MLDAILRDNAGGREAKDGVGMGVNDIDVGLIENFIKGLLEAGSFGSDGVGCFQGCQDVFLLGVLDSFSCLLKLNIRNLKKRRNKKVPKFSKLLIKLVENFRISKIFISLYLFSPECISSVIGCLVEEKVCIICEPKVETPFHPQLLVKQSPLLFSIFKCFFGQKIIREAGESLSPLLH
jgi:hypothetical protein